MILGAVFRPKQVRASSITRPIRAALADIESGPLVAAKERVSRRERRAFRQVRGRGGDACLAGKSRLDRLLWPGPGTWWPRAGAERRSRAPPRSPPDGRRAQAQPASARGDARGSGSGSLRRGFPNPVAAKPRLPRRNWSMACTVMGPRAPTARSPGTRSGWSISRIPRRNDWLAVNQFTVVEDQHNRRPDVVVFVNGLPLGRHRAEERRPTRTPRSGGPSTSSRPTSTSIPASSPATRCWSSPTACEARVGTLTADWERFMPWRTIDGRGARPHGLARAGGAAQGRVRQAAGSSTSSATSSSSRTTGGGGRQEDGRLPPVPRRQQGGRLHGRGRRAAGRQAGRRRLAHPGLGKSLTMAFYAGKVVRHPAMENPTLVVLTDRNDLDDQLFGTFSRCQDLLRQEPEQAERRDELRRAAQGRRRAASSSRRSRSSCPRRGATRIPRPVRPAQHRRHRRRGPPQPVRLHRRLRPPHARRPAQRLLHRLHRHADRADRQEHAGRLRRLHRRLRHPAGRRGRGDRPHLLRGPAGQDRAATRRRGPRIDPEFEEVTEGEEVERKEKLKTQVGAAGGDGRRREPGRADRRATSSSTSSSGWRRWTARR